MHRQSPKPAIRGKISETQYRMLLFAVATARTIVMMLAASPTSCWLDQRNRRATR